MTFFKKKHNDDLYNILLYLSRNIFFYKDLSLKDTFETRIYLMFLHYSIILFILKFRKEKPDQENYNNFFANIENDLRELGYGDISVNKKMKEINKIFYDILLKINSNSSSFKLNKNLVFTYFNIFQKSEEKWKKFDLYFDKFYKFCFDKSSINMIKEIKFFKL